MKLSDFDPNEVEYVGDHTSTLGKTTERQTASLRLSDFHPDEVEHVEDYVDPKTSAVTAATTGLIQGSVPFASSLAGAGKATMNAITGVSGPLAGGSMEDILDDYRSGRDQFQSDARVAAETNPKTAFAGNVAGGFANPLFSGGSITVPSVTGIARTVNIPAANTLSRVAAASAVQGLGMSQADLTKGELKELEKAAMDTGFSAAGGALGYGVGKAIPAVMKGAGSAGKKLLTTLGPSEEAINARLAGKAQDNAATYPHLAEKMGSTLKNLQSQINEASHNAFEKLSTELNIPKPYVTTHLDDAITKLKLNGKTVGPVDKRITSFLENLRGDVSELGDNISQKDLKVLIQKLDDNINWDDQSSEKLNNVLKGMRSDFDKTLKFQNSDYKKAILPVQVKLKILENLKKQFNFKNSPGEGLIPTDTTASKLQNSMSENKFMTQKNLGLLERHTGDDYLSGAKDYQLAKQFEKTGPNGAKRTALGMGLGYMIGHGSPLAVGVGTAVGSTLDHYGGKAVGNLLDGIVKAGNSDAFGKFKPIIEQASKRGPEAMAVTASILSQNPEFKNYLSLFFQSRMRFLCLKENLEA
jgi:hypothetical protein